MYSTEPKTARPETVEGEILTSLKLAGARGSLRTVLTPEDVLLELNNGNYLRLSHNKIEAMRHHQFHIVPHWCCAVGALLIYSSLRILNGQFQIWIGIAGVAIILSWLGFRRTALTIDSGDAGNYTLFGPVVDLIKFRVLSERIRDGIPFEKAREGLNEVIMSEYPSSSIFDELVENLENNINDDQDALALAMSDLINNSNENKNEDNLVMSDIDSNQLTKIETDFRENREPLLHGSISRARQVQSEMKSVPIHTGWTNVANRTEVLRQETNRNDISQQNINNEVNVSKPDEPFNLFGFGFDETTNDKEDNEPFNMFGEGLAKIDKDSIDLKYDKSSFSMMPDSVTNIKNTLSSDEKDNFQKPYLSSFQETGYSNPMNQIGINFSNVTNSESAVKNNSSVDTDKIGIVSKAKNLITTENETFSPVNVDGLKRISFSDKNRRLKRLKLKKNSRKRLKLSEMIMSSLGFKTPKLLRSRANKNDRIKKTGSLSISTNTIEALKVQSHQSHEAQIADALRKINNSVDEVTEKYLAEISSDLVDEKLPVSFQDFKSSNEEKNDVLSDAGIVRLD
tara:strand:+ start:4763 stop:6469 length:1707 start_codon:yes stop_codon:yes gene_type:complete